MGCDLDRFPAPPVSAVVTREELNGYLIEVIAFVLMLWWMLVLWWDNAVDDDGGDEDEGSDY